jgi:lipoprotein-releasing system ATP-binding protein
MIKAKQIKKSYGDLAVLNGVDLEIDKGEIVSIVGKSGAGKSTLLHILGTLDLADSGDLIINDTSIKSLNSNELADFRNKNIGFVFQFHHLLPEFTALENVCLPALIQKQAESDAKKRGKELLDYLGLGDRLTHRPTQLSAAASCSCTSVDEQTSGRFCRRANRKFGLRNFARNSRFVDSVAQRFSADFCSRNAQRRTR